MSTKTLITRLSCGLLLTSTLLHAAPQEQNDPHNGKHGTPAAQSSQPGKPSNQRPSQGKPQTQNKPQAQQSQGKPHQSASKAPGQAQGGNVPASVHIQAGKPLPAGYGKRLDSAQLKGVPTYAGYEWRRVGSDMVLVAITTGIVHTILSGVLN